jgi:putative transposase
MSRKRYTPEEIIGKLREAEVRLSQGEKIGVICRALGYRSRATIAGVASMAA